VYHCKHRNENILENGMNYRDLSNGFIDIVVEQMHGFDAFDRSGPLLNYRDVQHLREEAIRRYRSDPVFRAKVQSIVGRLIDCVYANTKEKGPAATRQALFAGNAVTP